ncbi:MAG: hypothetical protein DWQ34_21850 [Planctomycetota bacterium]|nr:MAG: hypothetical protein DWQ34_21850 [Planctomycetota bacterium]REK20281.1 MAG: hypothetical protein DWQ41_25755 [Planctomycetota bacterium]REK34710.1 MAG: hypothetical protein DWQ45_12885 [Planctomycetota bacterium]
MLSQLLSEDDYPDELVNLYNPGFTGSVIFLAGHAYQEKAGRSLPFVYPYIVITLVAVDEFRQRLPSRVAGRISDWVQTNADVLIGFPARAVALKPFVDSGIVFLSGKNLVKFEQDGCRFSNRGGVRGRLGNARLSSGAVENELRCAGLLGRWLAGESDISSVLAFFGIKP